MTPLYIFDLDGTLALIEHRLHYIQNKPKDWRAFFSARLEDAPNVPVIRTLKLLQSSGAEVWIWSGRSDECRAETREWLCQHLEFAGTVSGLLLHEHPFLMMRTAGDYRDDAVVKAEWLEQMAPDDRKRLVAIFDDRDRVVQMWRNAGVPCFQVAPGGF